MLDKNLVLCYNFYVIKNYLFGAKMNRKRAAIQALQETTQKFTPFCHKLIAELKCTDYEFGTNYFGNPVYNLAYVTESGECRLNGPSHHSKAVTEEVSLRNREIVEELMRELGFSFSFVGNSISEVDFCLESTGWFENRIEELC